MGMFDKFTRGAKNAGAAAGKAGSTATVATQEQTELIALRSQINVINQELEAAYTQIGRRYVEYVMESGDMPGIQISDMLALIDPKMTRRQELEQKIMQLEREINQRNILREKAAAEQDFVQEKQKLDKALAMELLTRAEYDARLAAAKRKLDNFEAIRKVEQQAAMGLITSAEKKERIAMLTAIEPSDAA